MPMNKTQMELPAMFGDHHVLAVRNILLALDGVIDVWASAAWRTIEITYDPDKTSPEIIARRLSEEGYMQPAAVPVLDPESRRAQRYSATLSEATRTIGFTEKFPPLSTHQPLYPCPGMTPLRENAEPLPEEA